MDRERIVEIAKMKRRIAVGSPVRIEADTMRDLKRMLEEMNLRADNIKPKRDEPGYLAYCTPKNSPQLKKEF